LGGRPVGLRLVHIPVPLIPDAMRKVKCLSSQQIADVDLRHFLGELRLGGPIGRDFCRCFPIMFERGAKMIGEFLLCMRRLRFGAMLEEATVSPKARKRRRCRVSCRCGGGNKMLLPSVQLTVLVNDALVPVLAGGTVEIVVASCAARSFEVIHQPPPNQAIAILGFKTIFFRCANGENRSSCLAPLIRRHLPPLR
jgi:hypothetical protein